MTNLTVLDARGRIRGLAWTIDFRPTNALATLVLDPGSSVRAEAGAMVAMGPGIELTTEVEGGLWSAVKRSAGGRSMSVSTFTAREGRDRLLLAPPTPGDLVAVGLNGQAYDIAGHAYLAASQDVAVDTRWGGAKAFFASDNALVVQASGNGVAFLGAFGVLLPQQLAPGEKLVVDTGHLVAWDASLRYEIRKAATSAWKSMASGEGLVAEFTGPGNLFLQSRNIEALAAALKPHLPGSG
ncbi:TIGR00266 family protein [Pseudonocardia sp. TMWB2A]|uniref:TIGR00266 family protein n=1 Tax=Pseudonocardia sp. TMWB2A TaxID=687430 RepID=UPI00307E9959